MSDVEDKNDFYEEKHIICQYKRGTKCFNESEEGKVLYNASQCKKIIYFYWIEKEFQGLQLLKDKLVDLGEFEGYKWDISFVQVLKTLNSYICLCLKIKSNSKWFKREISKMPINFAKNMVKNY